MCDEAKLLFEDNNEIIKKKWKYFQKLLNSKNLSRKECILLPFKAVKKIVSD